MLIGSHLYHAMNGEYYKIELVFGLWRSTCSTTPLYIEMKHYST